jgi:hypothetical protein
MTGLNRAGFYRWRTPRQATPVEMELCDQMREVALEPAAYGYRRITSALQKRGFAVKHQFGISPSRRPLWAIKQGVEPVQIQVGQQRRGGWPRCSAECRNIRLDSVAYL